MQKTNARCKKCIWLGEPDCTIVCFAFPQLSSRAPLLCWLVRIYSKLFVNKLVFLQKYKRTKMCKNIELQKHRYTKTQKYKNTKNTKKIIQTICQQVDLPWGPHHISRHVRYFSIPQHQQVNSEVSFCIHVAQKNIITPSKFSTCHLVIFS